MKRITKTAWRDAASVMVFNKNSGRFKVFTQTRTNEATYKNTAAFPGGVSELADNSDGWLRLFEAFGFTRQHFEMFHRKGVPVTPIFEEDPIRRHIALRITAIRETFEEMGFLICRRQKKECNDIWANVLTDIDTKYWRDKVQKCPDEMLNLCIENHCYPDIWSLHYWSNWLSPLSHVKRFNTVFFVAAVKNKPRNITGNAEVVSTQWMNPADLLARSSRKDIKIAPPQVYELTRISQLNKIEDVINSTKRLMNEGDDLYYPVVVKAKDGIIHLLRGDDAYPKEVDFHNDTISLERKTVQELREGNKVLHRTEEVNSRAEFVIKNYKTKFNHSIDIDDGFINFYNVK